MTNKTLPVAVHVFLIKNGRILLIKRKNTGFKDGQWSVPAGRANHNETLRQSAIREIKEEVGLLINQHNLIQPLVMHYHGERGERLYVFFACKQWEGVPQNIEKDKCEEIAWFTVSKLPESTVDHVRKAIELASRNITFIELGF